MPPLADNRQAGLPSESAAPAAPKRRRRRGSWSSGRHASARSPERESPPSARRIGVGFADRAVDEEVFEVGVRAQLVEKTLPYPGHLPSSEPRMRAGPCAELGRQVAPGRGCPRQLQHRIHEQPVIGPAPTRNPLPPRKMPLDPRPLRHTTRLLASDALGPRNRGL
jgi:hypothetical protein